MTKEDCGRFLHQATGLESEYIVSADDPRILSLFLIYDDNRDDLLSFEEFARFYRSAAMDRPAIVWVYSYRWCCCECAMVRMTPTAGRDSRI